MTRKKSAARSRLHIEHFTAGPHDTEKSAVLNRLHIEHFTAGPHDTEKVRRPELKSPTKLTESFLSETRLKQTPKRNASRNYCPYSSEGPVMSCFYAFPSRKPRILYCFGSAVLIPSVRRT